MSWKLGKTYEKAWARHEEEMAAREEEIRRGGNLPLGQWVAKGGKMQEEWKAASAAINENREAQLGLSNMRGEMLQVISTAVNKSLNEINMEFNIKAPILCCIK